jgi:hypothetical protein
MQDEKFAQQQAQPAPRCGVGIHLQPLQTGEYIVKGLAPGSPAAETNMLQVRRDRLIEWRETSSELTSVLS